MRRARHLTARRPALADSMVVAATGSTATLRRRLVRSRRRTSARDDLPGGALLRSAIAGRRRGVIAGTLLLALHQVAEALVPVMVGAVIERGVAAVE